jgi:hypothetical protein
VQASAAEKTIFLDECGFEAPLTGSDGSGVSGRAAADDGDVINSFRQAGTSDEQIKEYPNR